MDDEKISDDGRGSEECDEEDDAGIKEGVEEPQ